MRIVNYVIAIIAFIIAVAFWIYFTFVEFNMLYMNVSLLGIWATGNKIDILVIQDKF